MTIKLSLVSMNKIKSLTSQFISNIKTHDVLTNAKRNLILSILKSTTTKREARNYLEKYQSQFDFSDLECNDRDVSDQLTSKESQRGLFIERYLNKKNPFLSIYNEDIKLDKIPLRIALFKIKFQTILNLEWKGISETFKRLTNLGISPIIMLDYDHLLHDSFKHSEIYMSNQANKLLNFLNNVDNEGLRSTIMRSLFTINNGKISINSLEEILIPLYQGTIPIVQPIVYNADSTHQNIISSNSLLFNLSTTLLETKDILTIEKIVMIDPVGGIPSVERNQTSHVFINLSQEYSDIVSELFIGYIQPNIRDFHLSNLETMREILQIANKISQTDDLTGIITTPFIMSINNDQLNPIIYNVLTDRPIISSSLPSTNNRTPQLSTSIIKHGVVVNVYDKDSYDKSFTLDNLIKDKLVQKDRLIELINDSFGKELKVDEYLNRINENLATLIIIGDYDGAAIITWESSSKYPENVAYLDKFAIAKRNQGLPGLADIIFKLILQSHPNELIWRSRKNNPVNKWYFDRCRGCMSNPDSQWKIFYTGEIFNKKIDKSKGSMPDKVNIRKKLQQYCDIGESIPPSF